MKTESDLKQGNSRRWEKKKKKEKHMRKVSDILSFISAFCFYFWKILSVCSDKHNLVTGEKINHTFKWRQMPYPLGVAPGWSYNGLSLLLSPSFPPSGLQGWEFPCTSCKCPPIPTISRESSAIKTGQIFQLWDLFSYVKKHRGPWGPNLLLSCNLEQTRKNPHHSHFWLP